MVYGSPCIDQEYTIQICTGESFNYGCSDHETLYINFEPIVVKIKYFVLVVIIILFLIALHST